MLNRITLQAALGGLMVVLAQVQPQEDPRLHRLWQAAFWAAMLLFIFLVAAGVILSFSARFRAWLLRKKAPPTPAEDVWSMHRTPAEFPEQFPDDHMNDEEDEPGGEKY